MAFFLQQPLFSQGKATVIILAFFSLTACAPAANVQSAYDPTVNFSIYQTFIWHPAEVPAPKQGSGGLLYTTLLDQRVKEAIASELVKEGITPNPDNPGLLVAYDITVQAPQESSTIIATQPSLGYGYSYWYGYRYRYSGENLKDFRSIEEYKVGSLVIDLIDQDTNQVVWRGIFEADIDPVVIDVDKINRAVARVMSAFPPIRSTFR